MGFGGVREGEVDAVCGGRPGERVGDGGEGGQEGDAGKVRIGYVAK